MSLPMLDVAIGLSFIYLLLALVCTSVHELLAGFINKRGKFLDLGITRLLSGDLALKNELYRHPLIRGITIDETRKRPSYIAPQHFATALMDVITGPGKSRSDIAALNAGIEGLSNKDLQTTLRAVLAGENEDSATVQKVLEQWFNDGMDRVSGWYKRNTQWYVLGLAVFVTLAMNADTVQIGRKLWTNPALRAQFVTEAAIRANQSRPEEMLPLVEYPNPDEPTESKPLRTPQSGLNENEERLLSQVMGWPGEPKTNALGYLAQLIGWMITAAAVSLGAPFWFDTLNRIMNIRNAGRSPTEARGKTATAAPEVK